MTEYLEKSAASRGMEILRRKTPYMDYKFEPVEEDRAGSVKIMGEDLNKVRSFKYLGQW